MYLGWDVLHRASNVTSASNLVGQGDTRECFGASEQAGPGDFGFTRSKPFRLIVNNTVEGFQVDPEAKP